MPDYSNGKIYTIRCKTDDSKIYVGSTIQPLAVRFGGHKRNSRTERKKHYKLYAEINDNWDDWYIELYENYPCSCKEELCKREGEVIRLIGNLNVRIEGRDKKQYCIDNVEKKKEYDKQYRIENADKRNTQKKEYYLKKKEEKIKSIGQSEEHRQI